jgi:hypothetical protein
MAFCQQPLQPRAVALSLTTGLLAGALLVPV